MRAGEVEVDLAGAVVGIPLDPEGDGVDLGGDAAAVLVVGVHDRHPGLVEQPPLGGVVRVHRAVEVEMVLGEVREQLHREPDARDAAELDRVRGHLHGDGRVAGVEHAREGRLEVDRLGRGALDLLLHPADDPLDGAEQAGLVPGGLEQVPDEERGRRLAVRAGDAHHVEPGGRISVEASRRGAHGGAHVVDHDLRDAQVQPALGDERHRAPFHGLGSELVPVTREARHAKKQRPWGDAVGGVRERRDLDLGRPAPHQVAKGHGFPQVISLPGRPVSPAGLSLLSRWPIQSG